MNYETEAKEILRELFYEKWMSESDYEEFITEFFRFTGLSYSQLAEQLKTGVANGHSVENQKTLLRKLLNPKNG